ncbi:hypothetical protein JCM10449v2_003429 [Rhodotorula kratochvilovae]
MSSVNSVDLVKRDFITEVVKGNVDAIQWNASLVNMTWNESTAFIAGASVAAENATSECNSNCTSWLNVLSSCATTPMRDFKSTKEFYNFTSSCLCGVGFSSLSLGECANCIDMTSEGYAYGIMCQATANGNITADDFTDVLARYKNSTESSGAAQLSVGLFGGLVATVVAMAL